MNYKEALKLVKEKLTVERYEHTIRVMETSQKLARIHNVDVEKATIAAIFHDYAKCFRKEDLKQAIIFKDNSSPLLSYHHELWHAEVGANIAENEFFISDHDVINAIRFHTTGRKSMSNLEKVIYIADYIEPARNFPGIEKVRNIAEINLNNAVFLALQNTILFLVNKGQTIYPATIDAYNEFIFNNGISEEEDISD